MKNNVKDIAVLALKLTAIVAVVVLMLAIVNGVTKNKIEENSAQTRNEACRALIADADFEEVDISGADIDYSGIENFDKKSVTVYKGSKDGQTSGWCVEVTGKGSSSDGVGFIVGISADGETVIGVKCVSSSETSGIGSKVLTDDNLLKYGNADTSAVSDIDGVTGATRTSRAVKGAVEAAVAAVNALAGKEAA